MSVRHAAAVLLGLILLPVHAGADGKATDAANAAAGAPSLISVDGEATDATNTVPAAVTRGTTDPAAATPDGSTARPANDAATRQAFDALLSLPQAKPEVGSWDVVAPVGFDDASEAGLIRWLGRQQQAGADLDATRHKGSLLQHAVRSGLEDTALWLLQQGADPLRTLDDSPTEHDTLALAMRYRRWKVLDVLLRRADVTAPGRDAQIAGVWQEAIEHNGNGDLERLLALGLRWPEGRGRGWVIRSAVHKNCYGLLQRLIPQLAAGAASGATAIPLCGASLPPEQLQALDANLSEPLLPQLIAQARSQEELDALATLPLRRPYQDLAFMRPLLFSAMYRLKSTDLQSYAVKQLPLPALKAALADEYIFRDWLRWAALQPAATGDWALDLLGDSLPQRAALALKYMSQGLTGNDIVRFDPEANTPQLSAGWGRLLRRLPTPLPVVYGVNLWRLVPAAQRPLLLLHGYTPSDEQLSDWLNNASPEQLEQLWPALAQALPKRRGDLAELLFKGYGFVRDHGCHQAWPQPALLQKAQLLKTYGATMPAPLPLPQRCADEADKEYAAALRALEAAGFIQFKPAGARFVPASVECRFTPDAVWRRALMSSPGQFSLPLRSAKLLPVPGAADCAVLVTAGQGGGRETVVEESLDGTESYLGECAAEETEAAILRRSGDGFTQLRLDAVPRLRNLCAIKDLRDGSPLLLSGMAGDERYCGAIPLTLLRWTDPAVPPQALAGDSEPVKALETLCREEYQNTLCYECSNDDQLNDFIDQHWASDKAAFLTAVKELDQAELTRQHDATLPSHWIDSALYDLAGDDTLAPAEKRKRIAWLLHEPALNKSVLYNFDAIEQLAKWLPGEDWQPLIDLAGNDEYLLRSYLEIARRQGREDLACRWQQAAGAACEAPSP